MSDYQARSRANDMSDPSNRTSCPEVEEHGEIANLKSGIKNLKDWLEIKDKKIASLEGQIEALNALVDKKDGQIELLLKAATEAVNMIKKELGK